MLHFLAFSVTYLCRCFGAPACAGFPIPDHLITYLLTSADVSVAPLAGFSLITCSLLITYRDLVRCLASPRRTKFAGVSCLSTVVMLPNLSPAALLRTHTLHSSPTSELYAAMMEGTTVVVKRTKITSRGEIERFAKEVALLRACSHRNVVQPLALMRAPPTYAFVMPLFPHGSLFGVLHNSGRQLSLRGALSVLADVSSAVAHLHEVGVLHRDVKSDNVLFDGSWRAVLVDFNASEKTADVLADIVAPSRPSGGFFKQFVVRTPSALRHTTAHTSARAVVHSLTRSVPPSAGGHPPLHGTGAAALCAGRGVHGAVRRLLVRHPSKRGAHPDHPVLGCADGAGQAADHPRGEVQRGADSPPLPSPLLSPHPSLLTPRSSPLHPPPLPTRYNYEQLTAAIATDGLRPCQPEADAFPPALLELTRRCWAEDVQRRPRASEAHAVIAELLRTAGGGGEGGEGEGGCGCEGEGAARELFVTSAGGAPEPAAPAKAGGSGAFEAVAGGGEAASAAAAAVEAAARLDPEEAPRRARAAMAAMAGAAGAGGAAELRVGAEASVGKRGSDRMEDRHVLLSSGGLTLAAVLDGHNGEAAAHFCATHLPVALQAAWDDGSGAAGAAAALRASFWGVHRAFAASRAVDRSGATALAALCLPGASPLLGRVLVANAGDCCCKVWRRDALLPLSRPHTAEAEAEQARVREAGGEMRRTADGKLRVQGIIQVTRTLGDLQLQRHGLTPEPEVRYYGLPAHCPLCCPSTSAASARPPRLHPRSRPYLAPSSPPLPLPPPRPRPAAAPPPPRRRPALTPPSPGAGA